MAGATVRSGVNMIGTETWCYQAIVTILTNTNDLIMIRGNGRYEH